ncbi:exodeoxyribonuclease V subunit beta [Ursidibacter arcticus]
MQTLDPISLPLDRSCLIEASAGTGKTYTMANLYLRLLLGVGCEPLMVEQILVVTFTKAATQELRDRIRKNLGKFAEIVRNPTSPKNRQTFIDEPFFAQLYEQVQHNEQEALLRLKVAEQDIDLASIFTIDSFCQKMLFQFAFDSGVRFDIDLQTDESELLRRLSEETWRELFYTSDLQETKLVAELLISPNSALRNVKHLLSGLLPELTPEQQAFLSSDYVAQAAALAKFIANCKSYWQENHNEIISPIQQILALQQQGQIKVLDGRSYKEDSLLNKWLPALEQWANSESLDFPTELKYFSQSHLAEKTSKGADTPENAHFLAIDEMISTYQQSFANTQNEIKTKLLYRYFNHLNQKLQAFKNSHSQKNFSDMLHYFYHALYGQNGKQLAEKIRQQYTFAMIDESQDTDQIQYQIFKQIFMMSEKPSGFIMIGDPKQSIYKFRGADIFSYLDASEEVSEKFTLPKNWRSLPEVVDFVNQLFLFKSTEYGSPFIYPEITFLPVESKETKSHLCEGQHAINFYLHPKKCEVAEQCAEQIATQLIAAQRGELFVAEQKISEDEQGNQQKQLISRTLQPKDIAILVRSHSDAAQIQQALAKRNIQSVFLSERSSIYQTQEAADLLLILTACLNPLHQKSVLAAIGCGLWGLDSNEIYQLKHSEERWDNCVESFIHYQQIWQQQGILPMLHQLYIQQLLERVRMSVNADRRITNMLHLAELLQERMETAENESSLLRWFAKQIEEPDANDEQILRLESEEDLVKIITIHKSKGLEYPVVWLPFLGKTNKGADTPSLAIYRNQDKQQVWLLGEQDDDIKNLRNNEEYAEELRLLYVALTRAKYQLHLMLPEEWTASWSAMHYVLTDGNISKDTKTEECLARKGILKNIIKLNELSEVTKWTKTAETQSTTPQARVFKTKINESGLITSFTALQAQNERLQNREQKLPLVRLSDDALDYDSATVPDISFDETGVEQATEQALSPYQFPHSTKVGNLLHRYFELLDFTQPIDIESIQTLCEQLNLSPEWVEPTQQWLTQVLNTPFGDQPFKLSDIPVQKRLNEWQFYLRLRNKTALPKLNILLKQHSPFEHLPDLQLPQLEGFVRGFIDCIVEHQGKYYLLDYKSNFLGIFEQDYTQDRLAKTMIQFRYDLQYLLYTLAFHRYLHSRLGKNYDYQRDFGGVAYLFLRAMNEATQNGVFFDKPSMALISALDELFD